MMEQKTIKAFATKILDADQGIVEHIIAVMGNVDLGGDRIHRGAFAKTLVEGGSKVKVLDQHRTETILAAVGKPLVIREVGREELPEEVLAEYPEVTGGLWARTQFLMDTPEGVGVFARIKANAINEWSFGYDPVKADFTEEQNGQAKRMVRELRELKLYEYSPVLWGMNEATTTLSAKAQDEAVPRESKPWGVFPVDEEYCVFRVDDEGERMGDSLGCHPTREEARGQVAALYATEEDSTDPQAETKGVSGAMGLPLASRERAWNASAARGRVQSWAGADEAPNAKYRRAFFWFDTENSDQFGAYKLPFADVIDGTLTAVPRGMFAVAGALRGARTPLAIPQGDQAAIRGRVGRYYARMRSEFDDEGIVPPWDNEAGMVLDFEGKVGRVLSQRNATRISAALRGLIEVLENAGIDLSSEEGPDEEDKLPLRVERKLINLDELRRRIVDSFYTEYPDVYPTETGGSVRHVWYLTEVWDQFVIVREEYRDGGGSDEDHLWRIPYTISDGSVEFAPKEQWVEGAMLFVPLNEVEGEWVVVRRSSALLGVEARGAAIDGQLKSEAEPPRKADRALTSAQVDEWMQEAMQELVAIELMEVEDNDLQ